MTQIIRSRDINILGLTEKDLENRVIVAVGYANGELLPPYKDCRKKDARRVMNYLIGKEFRTSRYSLHPADIHRRFRKLPKLVEIVGALAHGCVLVTAHYFLEVGSRVYISPNRVITSRKDRYPPFWVGRILLAEILSRKQSRKCLVYGRDFIFYEQ